MPFTAKHPNLSRTTDCGPRLADTRLIGHGITATGRRSGAKCTGKSRNTRIIGRDQGVK